MRGERFGSAVVRFIIGNGGLISDFVTIVSSGSPDLDALSCQLLTARGRYEPGLGGDGRPVAVKAIETVHWVLTSKT